MEMGIVFKNGQAAVLLWVIFTCKFVVITTACTAEKIKSSIKDFFSKFDQIRSFLQIWSHLLKKSLMENFFVQ